MHSLITWLGLLLSEKSLAQLISRWIFVAGHSRYLEKPLNGEPENESLYYKYFCLTKRNRKAKSSSKADSWVHRQLSSESQWRKALNPCSNSFNQGSSPWTHFGSGHQWEEYIYFQNSVSKEGKPDRIQLAEPKFGQKVKRKSSLTRNIILLFLILFGLGLLLHNASLWNTAVSTRCSVLLQVRFKGW